MSTGNGAEPQKQPRSRGHYREFIEDSGILGLMQATYMALQQAQGMIEVFWDNPGTCDHCKFNAARLSGLFVSMQTTLHAELGAFTRLQEIVEGTGEPEHGEHGDPDQGTQN
jgi:hypothetical protein